MTSDSARREERPETIMVNHGLHLSVACAPASEPRRYELGQSEMAFSDMDIQKIKKIVAELCTKRTPEDLKDQLRFEYEIQKQNIIILEVRPVWNNPTEYLKLPMAKLSFVKSQKHVVMSIWGPPLA